MDGHSCYLERLSHKAWVSTDFQMHSLNGRILRLIAEQWQSVKRVGGGVDVGPPQSLSVSFIACCEFLPNEQFMRFKVRVSSQCDLVHIKLQRW